MSGNRIKKKTSQLLALCMAAMLVLSSFGSATAVAATSEENVTGVGLDCGIVSYKATDALAEGDKSDSEQKNTQTTNLTSDEDYYTNLLLQSAEWTNKAEGTAELNIHYTADSSTSIGATRSLYIFTTCNRHGFTEKIAIENIIELLEYNEYVDIVMIGATNYSKGGNDDEATEVGAVLMFTLKANDFVDIEDGATYLNVNEDNVTTYTDTSNTATKAWIIKDILETYTNADLISKGYVHVLGCATDDNCSCSTANYYTECADGDDCTDDAHDNTHYYDGYDTSYGPYIEVLFDTVSDSNYSSGYKFGDYGISFTSAAALGLTFQPASHVGGLFSLYYIAEYIDIIEANYGSGSFSSTVENILNSFDAFVVADKNLPVQSSYTTETLYKYVKEYVGLDLTAENMDLSDMESKCSEALSVIHEYNAANRYISLIPYDQDDQTGDALGFDTSHTKYQNSSTEELNTAINTIFYCLALICPTDDILNKEASWSLIDGWIKAETSEEDVYAYLKGNYNDHIYTYQDNLETLKVLAEVSSIENSVTITTTIDSAFELVQSEDGGYNITVKNSGNEKSSFDYEIKSVDATTNDDDSTIVTIEFTDLSEDDTASSSDWIIDISIPVKLKNNMEFRTGDSDDRIDWFKDINGSGDAITTAIVTRTVTRTNNMVQTYTEKVTVDSPQLYKAPPSLSIEKTSDVSSAKVGGTVKYTLTVSQTEANATATGVVVTDSIPQGLSYVDDSVEVTKGGDPMEGVTASYDGGVLRVSLGDVAYGDDIEITYSVTVDEETEGQSLKNVATVTSDNADSDEDAQTITVENEPVSEPDQGNPEDEGGDPEDGDPEGETDGEDSDLNDDGSTGSGSDDGDTGSDNTDTTGSSSGENTSTTTDNKDATDTGAGDTATDSSDEFLDEGSADNGDDDETSTGDNLPKAGDTIGALLPIIASVALGACAVAALAAFALKRHHTF